MKAATTLAYELCNAEFLFHFALEFLNFTLIIRFSLSDSPSPVKMIELIFLFSILPPTGFTLALPPPRLLESYGLRRLTVATSSPRLVPAPLDP